MSVERAKAFLEHVSADSKARDEVQSHGRKVMDDIVSLAKRHGFEFSRTDLHHAVREKVGAHKISDAMRDDEANCIIALAKR